MKAQQTTLRLVKMEDGEIRIEATSLPVYYAITKNTGNEIVWHVHRKEDIYETSAFVGEYASEESAVGDTLLRIIDRM